MKGGSNVTLIKDWKRKFKRFNVPGEMSEEEG